jgi:predicted small lipoprotein YifL
VEDENKTPMKPARFVAVAVFLLSAAIAGCGSQGPIRSVLPESKAVRSSAPASTATSSPTTVSADPDAAIEDAVIRAHGAVDDMSKGYTIADDGWYAPSPVPGKPGYYYIDGDVVKGPPDDTGPTQPGDTLQTDTSQTVLAPESTLTTNAAAPAPTPTLNCKTFEGDVPPPCTDTGPFRRVFSGPGYSYALANITLPASNPMPTAEPSSSTDPDPKPLDGDTGYVYFEGWSDSTPDAGNSEFGLQYSAKNKNYSVYMKTYSPALTFIVSTVRFAWDTPVTLAIAGYVIGNNDYLHVAALGTPDGACPTADYTTPQGKLCLVHAHAQDAKWSPNGCCIMARMTTIGQTTTHGFYDGAGFGPIKWSGVELAKVAPTPKPTSTVVPFATESPWVTAGTQNWPPLQDKVVASGVKPNGETDTIRLTKLPDLEVLLSPMGCQHYKSSTTVDFSAGIAGNPGNLPVLYGWPPAGSKMTVPNSTLNNEWGLYIGDKATNATVTFGVGGGVSGRGFPVYVDLLYIDATGELSNRWDHAGVVDDDEVTIGSITCPT